MMRSMGRRESDSSPPIREVNGCAARIPESMRMVEPELPASSIAAGSRSAPPSMTTDPVLPLDLRPQRGHAGQCRLAIRAGGIIGDGAAPLGDRGQHSIAVGNGFIAGQRDDAFDGPGRGNDFAHEVPV